MKIRWSVVIEAVLVLALAGAIGALWADAGLRRELDGPQQAARISP